MSCAGALIYYSTLIDGSSKTQFLEQIDQRVASIKRNILSFVCFKNLMHLWPALNIFLLNDTLNPTNANNTIKGLLNIITNVLYYPITCYQTYNKYSNDYIINKNNIDAFDNIKNKSFNNITSDDIKFLIINSQNPAPEPDDLLFKNSFTYTSGSEVKFLSEEFFNNNIKDASITNNNISTTYFNYLHDSYNIDLYNYVEDSVVLTDLPISIVNKYSFEANTSNNLTNYKKIYSTINGTDVISGNDRIHMSHFSIYTIINGKTSSILLNDNGTNIKINYSSKYNIRYIPLNLYFNCYVPSMTINDFILNVIVNVVDNNPLKSDIENINVFLQKDKLNISNALNTLTTGVDNVYTNIQSTLQQDWYSNFQNAFWYNISGYNSFYSDNDKLLNKDEYLNKLDNVNINVNTVINQINLNSYNCNLSLLRILYLPVDSVYDTDLIKLLDIYNNLNKTINPDSIFNTSMSTFLTNIESNINNMIPDMVNKNYSVSQDFNNFLQSNLLDSTHDILYNYWVTKVYDDITSSLVTINEIIENNNGLKYDIRICYLDETLNILNTMATSDSIADGLKESAKNLIENNIKKLLDPLNIIGLIGGFAINSIFIVYINDVLSLNYEPLSNDLNFNIFFSNNTSVCVSEYILKNNIPNGNTLLADIQKYLLPNKLDLTYNGNDIITFLSSPINILSEVLVNVGNFLHTLPIIIAKIIENINSIQYIVIKFYINYN